MWLGNNINGSNASHPAKHSLKGQRSEIFWFQFFHKSSSNRPKIIPISAIFVLHTIGVNVTGEELTTSVFDTGGQSLRKFSQKFVNDGIYII
jgi:hypothetical protein